MPFICLKFSTGFHCQPSTSSGPDIQAPCTVGPTNPSGLFSYGPASPSSREPWGAAQSALHHLFLSDLSTPHNHQDVRYTHSISASGVRWAQEFLKSFWVSDDTVPGTTLCQPLPSQGLFPHLKRLTYHVSLPGTAGLGIKSPRLLKTPQF